MFVNKLSVRMYGSCGSVFQSLRTCESCDVPKNQDYSSLAKMVESCGPTTRSSVQTKAAGGAAVRRVTRAALEGAYLGCLAAEPRKPRTVGFVTDFSPIKRRSLSERSASETSDEGVGDLSSASPASLLPDIPPSLARPRHPLARVSCLHPCTRLLVWPGEKLWTRN